MKYIINYTEDGGKVGGASNMKRWHFENCKNKEVLND